MRVLIVEDNPQMRRLIKSIVGDLADAVCECEDGTEALETYVRQRPDWVLMDVELKSLDGIAASRQIMTDFPDARIVIVTSYDNAGLRRAAREAGACGYVLKDNLLDVRRLLTLSGG